MRFRNPEKSKLVNLLLDKFRAWIDETEPGLDPRVPPSRFLERLTLTRVGMDQNRGGIEPVKELLERSMVWR